MFGNVIYFDRRKITDYKSIITNKKNLAVKGYDVINEKTFGVSSPIAQANIGVTKNMQAEIEESFYMIVLNLKKCL